MIVVIKMEVCLYCDVLLHVIQPYNLPPTPLQLCCHSKTVISVLGSSFKIYIFKPYLTDSYHLMLCNMMSTNMAITI